MIYIAASTTETAFRGYGFCSFTTTIKFLCSVFRDKRLEDERMSASNILDNNRTEEKPK